LGGRGEQDTCQCPVGSNCTVIHSRVLRNCETEAQQEKRGTHDPRLSVAEPFLRQCSSYSNRGYGGKRGLQTHIKIATQGDAATTGGVSLPPCNIPQTETVQSFEAKHSEERRQRGSAVWGGVDWKEEREREGAKGSRGWGIAFPSTTSYTTTSQWPGEASQKRGKKGGRAPDRTVVWLN
jgi:hypothetical protein